MRLDVSVTETEVARLPVPAAPEMRRLHHLFSPEQMEFVLRRERARADRHRGEFSLVIFRSESEQRVDVALMQIARIILAHARHHR